MCKSHFNRVLAPEGELLSFASPKGRKQSKGDPTAAYFLCSEISWCLVKGLPADSPNCGIHAATLRAIPVKISGTRRGKRD